MLNDEETEEIRVAWRPLSRSGLVRGEDRQRYQQEAVG